MKRTVSIAAMAAVIAVASVSSHAEDGRGWEDRLAGTFSMRLREIERELVELDPQLADLPDIPIDDQGGSGGGASVQLSAVGNGGKSPTFEIRFRRRAEIDFVSLVPARRYDPRGLDASYGLPEAFRVELIDDAGTTIRTVASESNPRGNPARRGHPFNYQVTPAVEAAGIRVIADRLHPDPETDGVFTHAWAEVFAFEGFRDAAWGGQVSIRWGAAPSAAWQWRPEFMVDGETPLGLPEMPVGSHRNIGWISKSRASATEVASLTIDLGERRRVEAVHLFPARRPTSDLPSGFGFPRRLKIYVSDEPSDTADAEWTLVSDATLRNPGHNAAVIPVRPAEARSVKVEAAVLWQEIEGYPAFFALSEIKVLDGGENAAAGRPVRSSDGMLNLITSGGRFWSASALTDGFGPEGKLVPTREWLAALGERLEIETRQHDLRAEAAALVTGWRRAGLAGFVLLGMAGAFAIIALPIRYRVRARRELETVRQRIASDLHDEVGSNLGSIQMFADLAEGRSGPSEELKRIQRIAAETVSAVRDIVWLLRPRGDHRIATVEHLRETSSIMLESLDWKFTANDPAWEIELTEESNRDLFLYFREALHNILRHAKAEQVRIHAESADGRLILTISDDGVGIEPEKLARPATLRALRQRAKALGGEFEPASEPGGGTRLVLTVPVDRKRKRRRGQAQED